MREALLRVGGGDASRQGLSRVWLGARAWKSGPHGSAARASRGVAPGVVSVGVSQ
jgi:hypothetical protein